MTSGKPTSKFAAVLAAKNNVQEIEPNEDRTEPKKREESQPATKQLQVGTAPRRVGRPNAKRSDPDFVQTTAYIRKDTHKDIKRALLDDEQGRDFSELIEELLKIWLKSNS